MTVKHIDSELIEANLAHQQVNPGDSATVTRAWCLEPRTHRETGGMIVLTPQELAALTGRARPTAQARALEFMEIPYFRRPDGSVAVLRIRVEGIGKRPGATLIREPKLQP
jgi:hypothetical protein